MNKTHCLGTQLQNYLRYLLILSVFMSFEAIASPDKLKLEDLKEANPVGVKLYVFNCGEILANDLSLFNPAIPQGTKKLLANSCYLIVHPRGTLVWDTGLSDSLQAIEGGVDSGSFHLSVSKTLKSQFEEIAVDPLSVDFIAFSHLHFDHTGNAKYFRNATWLIQKPEYKLAFSPDAEKYFFNPADYEMLKNNNTIKLEGHYDVFGDQSVVIVSTPGHTPGHQVLYVNLEKTGRIVLSGDIYHFQENRVDYGIPVFNTKKETIHSFVLLDNLLDDVNANLWIQHDKPFYDSLRLAPYIYQ